MRRIRVEITSNFDEITTEGNYASSLRWMRNALFLIRYNAWTSDIRSGNVTFDQSNKFRRIVIHECNCILRDKTACVYRGSFSQAKGRSTNVSPLYSLRTLETMWAQNLWLVECT